jgi:hypothetical protein
MDVVPFLAALALMVLGFGLFCLAALLTFVTLWPYFTLGFRIAVLHTWWRVRKYIADTARTYFRRLMRYGHTLASTTIAVIFSLVIWLAAAASFTFPAYWRLSLFAVIILPAAFLLAAWWTRGPAAIRHRFDFACTFFEPAIALVLPSMGNKLIDMVLQTLRTAF